MKNAVITKAITKSLFRNGQQNTRKPPQISSERHNSTQLIFELSVGAKIAIRIE